MRTLGVIVGVWVVGMFVTPARASTQEGAALYAKDCAACHGTGGKGDGPAASSMNPAPTDLTRPDGTGTLTVEQLTAVIQKGKGSMPGFGAMLKPGEAKALAEYIHGLSAETKKE